MFGVALAVRLLHGLAIRGEPALRVPLVDEGLYWQDALRLISGAGLDPVLYRPPLESWLLAAIVRAVGPSAIACRFVLLGLSALAAPLTAALARPIVGRAGAILAGLFMALSAPAIFYGGELLPASTVLLLDLLALLVLAHAERSRRVIEYGAAGAALGVSALAWPPIVLFVPCALVHVRRARAGALALVIGTAVALLPAVVHNARGGDRVFVSSNGGVNFYMGNHAGADGWSAAAPELPNEPGEARIAAHRIAERSAGRALRPSEASAYWARRAWEWMATDPAGAARVWVRKAYAIVNDREISDNVDLAAMKEISVPLKLAPVGFGFLLALSVPGIPILARSREGRLLLWYALAVTVPVLAFFVVGRFRLPVFPVAAVGAAAGILAMTRAVRRSARRGAAIGLLVAAVFLFTRTRAFGIDEDRTWHLSYLRGNALYQSGDLEGASRAFEESLRRNARVPETMNALAFVYAERGAELPRAESLAREAIRREPGRRRFYLDTLGRVLYRERRFREAADATQQALDLLGPEEGPVRAETLNHLADVRLAEGRAHEADSLRFAARALAPPPPSR